MDVKDPKYQEDVLKQKSQNDPREIAIREKITAEVLKEQWAKDAFAKIRHEQIDYLKGAVANVQDEIHVHDLTQRVLKNISDEVKSKIVEGKELLDDVPKGHPAIIVTNHFGAYKLLGINPKNDVGVDIPGYDAMYPYLMYFAALRPAAEAIGDGLYYASNDFPGVFGDIHRKAGFIHVPPIGENRIVILIEQNKAAITKRPNSAIVSFPEGTTSGKPSGRGPYDIGPFRTGAYVIAAELGIYIVPVAQYFDPKEGYDLKIMRPFIPEKGDKELFKLYAEQNRNEMQTWLDQRRKSSER